MCVSKIKEIHARARVLLWKRKCGINYGRRLANYVAEISKTSKGTFPPPEGCVCQKLKKSMLGLQSSAPETKLWTPNGQTDIRGDANTPRPHFVGRGIKTNLHIHMFLGI